ncbi:mitogen-activated protein kinase kinase kinase 1 [Phoenix dactylifera]|uniref:Mitogen-activated protein kinase kinase kinase 1 n=1 Tax=Phoenix dactylifera TaxID=42345 RepID=A0A8B7CAP9_PHODC|nr:mitogen-activated protein kinase kinase kinase 1 [Phoenix dactylifera]
MESAGPSTRATTVGTRCNPAQQVADRIIRALRHRLRLLHRSDANFFVLGATGNVYTVTLASTPSCTCPDRTVPCKHILFVLLRVLGLSFDDACIWRRTLRPCQLARLLGTPTAPDVLAGSRARERFHQVFSGNGGDAERLVASAREDDGAVCPICLEEVGGGGRLVTCGTCGNSLHGECLVGWKRSRGRRGTSCVVCRARWTERREQERYVNLAAYVSEEVDEGGGGSCAG